MEGWKPGEGFEILYRWPAFGTLCFGDCSRYRGVDCLFCQVDVGVLYPDVWTGIWLLGFGVEIPGYFEILKLGEP